MIHIIMIKAFYFWKIIKNLYNLSIQFLNMLKAAPNKIKNRLSKSAVNLSLKVYKINGRELSNLLSRNIFRIQEKIENVIGCSVHGSVWVRNQFVPPLSFMRFERFHLFERKLERDRLSCQLWLMQSSRLSNRLDERNNRRNTSATDSERSYCLVVLFLTTQALLVILAIWNCSLYKWLLDYYDWVLWSFLYLFLGISNVKRLNRNMISKTTF